MHKGLLCEYSAFFRTALKGNYFEAASREIHLEEDRVVDFDLFNGWLYNQTLLAKGQTVDEILWDTLIDLYLFADKRAIPSLMNAVVDLLIAKLESSPITTLILLYEKCAYVYSQTTKGSLLRQLVADSYACWASMFEYFRGIPEEDLPIEFIYDVALAYIKLHPEHSDGNFTILDAAEFYHVSLHKSP